MTSCGADRDGSGAVDTGPRRGVPTLPAVVLCLVGLATWLWWDAGRPGWPSDPPGLAVPEEGEVTARHLEDGSPVFVARFAGSVQVLAATSPGPPLDDDAQVHALTVYCRSSGLFEDLVHGSVFGRDGRWNGGPAPASLARHPARVVDGRVIADIDAHPRDRPGRSTTTTRPPPTGPSCGELPVDERAEATTGHVPDTLGRLDRLDGDEWTWIDARFETDVAAPHRVRVCDAHDCAPSTLRVPSDVRLLDRPVLARRDAEHRLRLLVPPATAPAHAEPSAAGAPAR